MIVSPSAEHATPCQYLQRNLGCLPGQSRVLGEVNDSVPGLGHQSVSISGGCHGNPVLGRCAGTDPVRAGISGQEDASRVPVCIGMGGGGETSAVCRSCHALPELDWGVGRCPGGPRVGGDIERPGVVRRIHHVLRGHDLHSVLGTGESAPYGRGGGSWLPLLTGRRSSQKQQQSQGIKSRMRRRVGVHLSHAPVQPKSTHSLVRRRKPLPRSKGRSAALRRSAAPRAKTTR